MIEALVAGISPEEHELPYWDALREHRLVLQRCADCGRVQHYPRSVCSSCLASVLEFVESPGRGVVYSFTVVQRAPLPELRPLAPYALALIDLEEGVRMMSGVVGDLSAIAINIPGRVEFLDIARHVTLPIFRPATDIPGES